MSILRKSLPAVLAAAMLSLPTTAPAKQTGTDWLWLSGSLDVNTCVWTVTVNWGGYKDAKYIEVFATEGYAGAPLVSTVVQIQNKDSQVTVALPLLATAGPWTLFYPWAQALDVHGNAIPASLDFSGGNYGYCSAP